MKEQRQFYLIAIIHSPMVELIDCKWRNWLIIIVGIKLMFSTAISVVIIQLMFQNKFLALHV